MSLQEEKKEYSLDRNIHFTYKVDADKDSLCQGDVLAVTPELASVLKEIHPYFINEQYRYFMVLSQSCDLVRRDGKNCKAPYITLAAIKSYNSFLEKMLVDGKMVDNVNGLLLMDEKKKERAYQLVERIYNNTEPEYFFLYKEEALDFSESMIAYLRVSIALKSAEHYDKCLAAKRLELSDEFKAKLGWLVGNMYSRVGTTDWDTILTSQERKDLLNNELTSKCIIGSREQLKILKKELIDKAEQICNHDEAVSYLSDISIPTRYDKVMGLIEEIIQTSSRKIPLEEKELLLKAIKSRTALKTLLS